MKNENHFSEFDQLAYFDDKTLQRMRRSAYYYSILLKT